MQEPKGEEGNLRRVKEPPHLQKYISSGVLFTSGPGLKYSDTWSAYPQLKKNMCSFMTAV